jgi:hypothetical protein
MIIDAHGNVSLYDGPDGNGSLISTEALDMSSSWYVRFFLNDGTSGGYPSDGARINLYDYSSQAVPVPGAVVMGILGVGMLGIVRKRLK